MIDVAMEAKDFDSGACFGGNRAAAVPVVAAKPAASKFRLHSAYKTPITTVPLQPSNKPAPSVNRQPQLDALAARQYPPSKYDVLVTDLFEDNMIPVEDTYFKKPTSKAASSLSIPESLWTVNWWVNYLLSCR